MSPVYRELLRFARQLHLYLTLFSLALILFFAVTGFMLNHEDWFSSLEPVTRLESANVPTKLLSEPDKLGIVELLRKHHNAVGEVDSFEIEDDQLRIDFKRPGSRVKAVIQRDDGSTNITYETWGFVGMLLDLHRGKSSGRIWSFVIDAICVILVLIAITGVFLWWSLKGRGKYGLPVLLIGVGVFLAVTVKFIP